MTIGLLKKWMCEMEVATWFLILASDTTMDEKELEDALSVISSKFSMYYLTFEEQGWKKNSLEKCQQYDFQDWIPCWKKKMKGKICYVYYPHW